ALTGLVLLGLLGALTGGVAPAPVQAATLPSGFTDGPVAAVAAPTDLAFTPDGRMLVTTQPGVLRMVKGGVLLPTPVLDLTPRVCSRREQGLLGVTVDPAFATTRAVYLYYTFKKFPTCRTFEDGDIVKTETPVNRVSRFILPSGSDVIAPASEVVLLDNIPSLGNHNAGDLNFGADGLLYASVGDAGCKVSDPSACGGSNDNSRNEGLPLGKILRVRTDGTIPSDNPNVSRSGARRCADPAGVPPGTGPCLETFAMGLRNPFRFAFRPDTDTFNINDVGQSSWEEVDAGLRGADYGWNIREGHCAAGSTSNCGAPPAGM